MDDLDHSMHISDHDWLNFFEESEECCLLHASLACPDSSGLSDGDDLDFAIRAYTPLNEQQVVEEQLSPAKSSAEEESTVKREPVGPQPEPELPVTKRALSCVEKERWFVNVSENSPQHRDPASSAVVKKKRKHKKIWRDKHKDGKDHMCGDTDLKMKLKVPEELVSDTNTENLGTEVLCKEEDGGNIRTQQTKTCAEINQLTSPNTEVIQEVSPDSRSIELNMDRSCLGVSHKDSTLHFAMENGSEPTNIKGGTGVDITKWMETSDTMFIHEKDPDLGCKSSQTKCIMDLTCTGDSRVEGNLDTSKSTKGNDFGHIQGEDSCKDKLQQTIDNTNNGNIVELNTTNNDADLGVIHRKRSEIGCKIHKQEDFKSFGASCIEDSLDLACKNHAESTVDTARPMDNPVGHTNSTESDEFADVEFFSSFSNDSETYHSAAESVEDPWLRSIHNSPCNLPISINNDNLADRGMQSRLQCDSSQPHIETSEIFPSAHLGVDSMPNDNSTCSDGTNSTTLSMSVDTPTSAGSSSSSLRGQPESLPQLEVTMESPEAYVKATGNNQPVYAISAFWDEMEKLTINDILHIRMERCMLPVEEAPNTHSLESTSRDIKSPTTIMPESAVLDTMDVADSDYCTNLDESKPDRSSCDFSTSDFEEEYWQFINSSRNSSPDIHDKSYQSQCADYVSTGEEESSGTPVPSEDSSGQKWSFGSDDVVVPHQMRKTKSMYDVHALKTIEDLSSQNLLDQSSCKSLEEPLNISDRFEVVTPIMCHTDEQYQISFPNVFEFLFDDNKAKCEAMSVSVYGLQGNPALPINNHTLFTTINDLALKHYREEPIPIFSCSRPTVRELTFPKPGSIFLGTNYTAMKDVSPIQILSQSIVRSMDCKQTDRAFCFSQDLSSVYLVKSICFHDKGSDEWRCQSEDEKPVDVIDSSITVGGEGGVFSMTPQMFKEGALRQISIENNQIPSDYQGIFSTIKQSDMCLVCIAFASWVLRSSDPKAADAWKAALLANVSALSAIQYLRQYMKKKASPQDD